MKVTFPHMGGTYAAAKAFLEDMGLEVIVPPFCNSKTLEIGVKNSPETICLPLKLNIGNFIQSIENGADTILITGSCGPCRFGYYGVVEKEILKDLGYDVNLIVIDPPLENIKSFMDKIKIITNGNSTKAALKAFYKAYNISRQLDEMDKMMFRIRPREKVAGSVKNIHNYYLKNMNKFHGSDQISGFIKDISEQIGEIEIDREIKPLRIGIIGEIYTVIEPFVNLYIEEKLGDLNVEVDRSMNVSQWLKTNVIGKLSGLNFEKQIEKAAEPYLKEMIGGHAKECIGNAVLYAREGYDGLIQLLPFSCMPEIVASSILPNLSQKENIPIMTLVVDELTGESGYLTRLEAFVDMLSRKREA